MLDPLLKQLATPPPQQFHSVPEDVLQTNSKRPRASPTKESEPKNDKKQKNEEQPTVADEAIMGQFLYNLDDLSIAYYSAKKKDIAKRIGLL
jgi:hypothetical protein